MHRDLIKDLRTIPSLVAELFFQPLLFLFVFGLILPSIGTLEANYLNTLVPGLIVMTAIVSGFSSVSVPLLIELNYTGELEDRIMAPVAWEFVALAKLMRAAVRSIAGATAFSLVAFFMVGFNAFSQGPLLWSAVLLASLVGSGLGLVIACNVSVKNIDAISSFVSILIIFTGCAQYRWIDLEVLPVVQYGVLLNPLTYATELGRGAFSDDGLGVIVCWVVLLSLSIVSWWVGMISFRRLLHR